MVLAILLPLQTHASGTGGYGSAPIQQRQVDRDYEHGKAIYNGRAGAGKKYAYCVELDGEKVPLKRKSLKSFKKGSAQAFATALYDCDRPDQKIFGTNVDADHDKDDKREPERFFGQDKKAGGSQWRLYGTKAQRAVFAETVADFQEQWDHTDAGQEYGDQI